MTVSCLPLYKMLSTSCRHPSNESEWLEMKMCNYWWRDEIFSAILLVSICRRRSYTLEKCPQWLDSAVKKRTTTMWNGENQHLLSRAIECSWEERRRKKHIPIQKSCRLFHRVFFPFASKREIFDQVFDILCLPIWRWKYMKPSCLLADIMNEPSDYEGKSEATRKRRDNIGKQWARRALFYFSSFSLLSWHVTVWPLFFSMSGFSWFLFFSSSYALTLHVCLRWYNVWSSSFSLSTH